MGLPNALNQHLAPKSFRILRLFSASPRVTAPELRLTLDGHVRDSLRPVSAGLTVLFAVFALAHAFLLPKAVTPITVLTASATSLALFALTLRLGRRPLPARWAHPIAAGIAALVLLNSLLHLRLLRDPQQSTNVSLLIIGAGCFLLSARWLALVVTMALGGWLVTAWSLGISPAWVHFGFMQLSATTIGVLVHAIRVRGIIQLYKMHLEDGRRRAELEEAIQSRMNSEERFRRLAESTFEGIAVHESGRILDANQALASMFGYRSQEVIGRSIWDLIAPQWRQVASEKILSETQEPFEAIGLKRDGCTFPIEVCVKAISSAERPVRVMAVRDISQRQEAEKALRASEERYRELFENANDLLYTIDLDGNFTSINRAAEEISGYTRTEAMNIDQIVVPEDRQLSRAGITQLLSGGAPPAVELTIVTKNGHRVPLEVKRRLMYRAGRPFGVQGIARDITERKRAEEKIRKLNEELERRVAERTAELLAVNQELEAFCYSVSHDLRAPLRSIDGFSQALLEDYADRLDAEGCDDLQRVRAAAHRMAQLIDDLLRLAQVTRSEMELQEVDLSALARRITTDLRAREPQREVELLIEDGLAGRGDPILLHVALENLLKNSWKFTRRHPRARIEFAALPTRHSGAKTDQRVYFVRDDGAGFDMAYVRKLFRPFERLHTAAAFEGTGIGLATVQRIVHRHGGRVWAEGRVEQGATVYFTLPYDDDPGRPGEKKG